ncbi:MAG: SRPBCC family protein [Thermoleophilia bacterium]|nr:SRPBCC family protein [Thermoleophilia bacterium]
MPEFTITSRIDAPVETVWGVLDDFGDIQRWNPGVKASELTSSGPVSEGSTRHCDFAPFGGVNERIDCHQPNQRLTVNINETFKLPISGAVADFNIAPADQGTELTLNYRYELNRLGRLMKGYTDKRMREGIGGLAESLQQESERLAVGQGSASP